MNDGEGECDGDGREEGECDSDGRSEGKEHSMSHPLPFLAL